MYAKFVIKAKLDPEYCMYFCWGGITQLEFQNNRKTTQLYKKKLLNTKKIIYSWISAGAAPSMIH